MFYYEDICYVFELLKKMNLYIFRNFDLFLWVIYMINFNLIFFFKYLYLGYFFCKFFKVIQGGYEDYLVVK